MTSPQPATDLRAFAQRLRQHVLTMTSRAGSSHVGSGLSMAEILAVLYGGMARVDPARPNWPDRDRVILSKGHACAGLYAALAEKGFLPLEELDTFCRDGSRLFGHATAGVPGVECSTGSLGHGLPIATGIALGGRLQRASWRVFAVLSDGECDEGSTWEAAMFAGHHGLSNLTVIVDCNKIQSLGATRDVLDLEPLHEKWSAFGWAVRRIDGHDVDALWASLSPAAAHAGRPTCVIADTVKGKGVSFMEHTLLWHYRTPAGEELLAALEQIGKPE